MGSTSSLWLAGACIALGILVGKKYPLIAGSLFAVALLFLIWGPGGLV